MIKLIGVLVLQKRRLINYLQQVFKQYSNLVEC